MNIAPQFGIDQVIIMTSPHFLCCWGNICILVSTWPSTRPCIFDIVSDPIVKCVNLSPDQTYPWLPPSLSCLQPHFEGGGAGQRGASFKWLGADEWEVRGCGYGWEGCVWCICVYFFLLDDHNRAYSLSIHHLLCGKEFNDQPLYNVVENIQGLEEIRWKRQYWQGKLSDRFDPNNVGLFFVNPNSCDPTCYPIKHLTIHVAPVWTKMYLRWILHRVQSAAQNHLSSANSIPALHRKRHHPPKKMPWGELITQPNDKRRQLIRHSTLPPLLLRF